MSILALQKQRDPNAGFAGDFLDVLERLAPVLQRQPSLKIVTNAGGMNPQRLCGEGPCDPGESRAHRPAIAVVRGDDLMPRLDELLGRGTRADQPRHRRAAGDRPVAVVSANAYLGSRPIVDALRSGASIVITGRVADASLTVAPAVHEFGWAWDDWDRLGAATVAGHLIECGAQATGGLWCNWQKLDDLANVGYPIAEIAPDGNFTITKPPGTGGAVNRETVSEQLLYEVGDPAAYLTPDVTADFTSCDLDRKRPRRGASLRRAGKPATDTYKVSIAYRDGFAASGTLVIAGPGAADKARRCGAILLERLRRIGVVPEQSLIECLGAGDSLPGVLPRSDSPEVVLRVAVRDCAASIVERFTKEFAPLVTSGPPGVTGYTTGRPAVREVFAYWPALIAKSAVTPRVEILS